MKVISSRDNPRFKALRKMLGHAGRTGAGAVLEGPHLAHAWLDHCGQPLEAYFDARRLTATPALAALAERLDPARCTQIEGGLLAQLSDVESDQGVMFVVQPPQPAWTAPLAESCVLLDRIQDPGNVGTLLRTCAAAGIRHVVLSAGCAHAWSPKVLRSGQGAHFALQIHEQIDLAQVLHERLAVPVYATALDGASSLYAQALPAKCGWLFGNEGQGVHPELLAAATSKIYIPHDYVAVESLNVAMAAAVCLFEHRRQHLA